MGTPSVSVIGRGAELAALAAFVQEIEAGSAALVLEGDAGAGKTTLWRAALDSARQRDWRVLTARPASAEAQLALAGLGDLLGDALDNVLDVLRHRRPRRSVSRSCLSGRAHHWMPACLGCPRSPCCEHCRPRVPC